MALEPASWGAKLPFQANSPQRCVCRWLSKCQLGVNVTGQSFPGTLGTHSSPLPIACQALQRAKTSRQGLSLARSFAWRTTQPTRICLKLLSLSCSHTRGPGRAAEEPPPGSCIWSTVQGRQGSSVGSHVWGYSRLGPGTSSAHRDPMSGHREQV